jgi:hypothetical protein
MSFVPNAVILAIVVSLPFVSFCTAAPVAITKVIPFTTANSIRLDIDLECSEFKQPISVDAKITGPRSETLWNGSVGTAPREHGPVVSIRRDITRLKPRLWFPNSPVLYKLVVTAKSPDANLAEKSVRIGFRSFESRNGHFELNGRPIFLRGLAINPPGRTIPNETAESRSFAEAYVRFLKQHNLNIIRMTYDSQLWFDVCDELGMMVYQGQYGSPPGSSGRKQEPPADFEKSIAQYKSIFETYAAHPSVMVYILSNELPVSGSRGRAFHDYLARACSTLREWDSTRLYIGNAGYGEGREGDICDVHRYWGWYYNTFLTYYNLRDKKLFGDASKNQPITFTECVGNFTGPLGEYNIVERKQLGAQLNWTGHSPEQAPDALEYQSFMIKHAAESFRTLRSINPRVCGLMPFTILFYNWRGISSFDQMKPKPAMEQLAKSYEPVLLNWELWTPQVYGGSKILPIAHIVNDSDDLQALRNVSLNYQLQSASGRTVISGASVLPDIPYYDLRRKRIEIDLPGDLPTGEYRLVGKVSANGRIVSENDEPLFIARPDWSSARESDEIPGTTNPSTGTSNAIWLYDPSGRTATALRRLGTQFKELVKPAAPQDLNACLIIGEDAWNSKIAAASGGFKSFIKNGGRILCLKQDRDFDPSWLPEPITFFTASADSPAYPPAGRPFSGNMRVNIERSWHAAFRGLDRRRFRLWSDYTRWDETKSGFPAMYPVTRGFRLKNQASVSRTAVLADYDRGLEGIALCEMFSGKGSVIVSGFDIVSRANLDPVADKFLGNLAAYVASPANHELHPLVEQPIEWGDYATERGTICGSINGLVVNADWVKPFTQPTASPLTQDEGAWNTRPGDQFVPHGRRLLGPYTYSTSTGLKDLDPNSSSASGMFWAELPSGRTRVVNTIENRSTKPERIDVFLGGSNVATATATIAPSARIDLSAPLPAGVSDIEVRFAGSKELVLLKTTFE